MSADNQLIAARLQTALATCNEAEAAQLAGRLAAERCRVRVYADPEAAGGGAGRAPVPDGSLLVSVTFQVGTSRLSQPVRMTMLREASVADLKNETLMAFGLPPDVQRCIVGGQLPGDSDKLGQLAAASGPAGAAKSLLQVRTYLAPRNSSQWPPNPQQVESLKESVRQMRQLRESQLETDEGSAGSLEQPPQVDDPQDAEEPPGWCCPRCTFRNQPGHPGCVMCGTDRPADYLVPPEFQAEEELRQEQLQADFLVLAAQERERNMRDMLTLAQGSLIRVANQEAFECPVCLSDIGGPDGDPDVRGVRLRECGHEVCSNCLRDHAINANTLPVLCPCAPCQQTMTDAELATLLSGEELARLQRLGLRQAEAVIANSFHCVTANCESFVELADEINDFECELCGQHNCVTCRASHKGATCQQYQDELRRLAQNDDDARLGLEKLEEMLATGEAMKCPKCKVFLQKKEGCDWLKCSVCQTEICWATRGPRWGPKGQGDTSGGCQCRVNNKKCHPQCMNCH